MTTIGLVLIVLGIGVRQPDRWWFSPNRLPVPPISIRELRQLQRERINDITPSLSIAGHWLEILGYWLLLGHSGVVPGLLLSLITALKFRHLQEMTHFSVHGVLVRRRRLGDLLAELAFQSPLALVDVNTRRMRHVRQHHPNATFRDLDPNREALQRAGLLLGASRGELFAAALHPLTPRGVLETLSEVWFFVTSSIRKAPVRLMPPLVVLATLWAVSGWTGLVYGYAVPRLLVYPMLAWLSLLVEHRWLSAVPAAGSAVEQETSRCLRLYPNRRILAAIARGTWLPYGDLYHFAHSVHPATRWNYLPLADSLLQDLPVAEFDSAFAGRSSAVGTLLQEANHGARQLV